MITYTDPAILSGLRDGNVSLFTFVRIALAEIGFNDLLVTDYPSDVNYGGLTYKAELLAGVERAPRTGNLTQEVQRILIGQGLSSFFADSIDDVIRKMGNKWHNTPVTVDILMETDSGLITSEPVIRNEGILKSMARSGSDNQVVIEFSNAFGRIDLLKELRTSTGSLARYNKEDTSFDRASEESTQRLLEWGTDGRGG